MREMLVDTWSDIRCRWRPLVFVNLVYKSLAFIVLMPLLSWLLRGLLATSGRPVLADEDVLFFLLGPAGWVSLIVVGALWVTIFSVELAALMAILSADAEQHVEVLGVLRVVASKAWAIVQVAARLIVVTCLACLPFVVIAGGVYWLLLTRYDINYYLQEKPPQFLLACGVGGVLLIGCIGVLMWLATRWIFALPLVVFEQVRPAEALRVSSERTAGYRWRLAVWLIGLSLVAMFIPSAMTTVTVLVGSVVVPWTTHAPGLLTLTIGISLFVWGGLGLAINVLITTMYAAVLFHLYRRLACAGEVPPLPLALVDASAATRFRMTRLRLVTLGGIGMVAAMITGGLAERTVRLEDDVEVIAHRGASAVAPENTLAAVKQAIEDGTDWVEIDVQETADGEVVVFHDSDFMKLAKEDLKIWDATRAGLQDIDIGGWFSDEFRDQRVPTLSQVLETCKGRAGVVIELKYYGHDQQLEQRVVDIVESHAMADSIACMSLKPAALEKMKLLRPEWDTGLLLSISAGDLQSSPADFLAVNAAFVTRAFIQESHRIGKRVYVWTVNDAVSMSAMMSRGVDGIITDDPALARAVLQQRARMSSTERLMISLAGLFGVQPEFELQ